MTMCLAKKKIRGKGTWFVNQERLFNSIIVLQTTNTEDLIRNIRDHKFEEHRIHCNSIIIRAKFSLKPTPTPAAHEIDF